MCSVCACVHVYVCVSKCCVVCVCTCTTFDISMQDVTLVEVVDSREQLLQEMCNERCVGLELWV